MELHSWKVRHGELNDRGEKAAEFLGTEQLVYYKYFLQVEKDCNGVDVGVL